MHVTPSGDLVLTAPLLGNILLESFPHREIARRMASLGCVIPGVRLETLDPQELADAFAEDALKDPRLMDELIQVLDQVHAEEREGLRAMTLPEIQKLIEPVAYILKEKKAGKILWVLYRDPRPEVRHQAHTFLKSLDRFVREQDRMEEEIQKFEDRAHRGRLKPDEVRKLIGILGRKEEEIKQFHLDLEKKDAALQKAEEQQERLRHEAAAFRKIQDQLQTELRQTQKESARFRDEAEMSRSGLAKLREEAREVERLKHEQHLLERENRKLTHEALRLAEKNQLLEEALAKEAARRRALEAEREVLQRRCLEAEESRDRALATVKDLRSESAPLVLPRAGAPASAGHRLGIFVDMQNLTIAARRIRRKIDFTKLLETLTGDRHLVKAVAYDVTDPAYPRESFYQMLVHKGFELQTRQIIRRSDGSAKGNWDTGIVVDAVRLADRKDLDIVLVVSGDGDFIELYKFLKAKGITVEAASFPFAAARDLPGSVDTFYTLNEDYLLPAEEPAFPGMPAPFLKNPPQEWLIPGPGVQ